MQTENRGGTNIFKVPGIGTPALVARQHFHAGEAIPVLLYEQTNDLLRRDGFHHSNKPESNVVLPDQPAHILN